MWLYWYRLFENHGQADIIGGSMKCHIKDTYNQMFDYEIYETRRGKYGLRFKNNTS